MFEPQKKSSLKLLNTIEERTRMIEKTGISNLIIQPFTREFSRLSALDFVRDILLRNELDLSKLREIKHVLEVYSNGYDKRY
mgnify:CR=1 FL=1